MMRVKRSVCVLLLILSLLSVGFSVCAADKIDVNTATVTQLIEVNGVGDVLAERIVEYRKVNGAFKSLEELEQVKGVGSKKLEKMLPYLKISKG